MKLSEKAIRALPKVLLHDHLDGGLRPQTVIDLAQETGYTGLPTTDAEELNAWFQRGAKRGSLPLYLEGFAHTCAVMQTEEALERVAYEMMEDMHLDGVVYVETRFAPVYHTEKGLHWEEIVSAVLRGLERGKKEFGVDYGLIICAMRNMTLSQEMAELAIDFRERGVVGFDLGISAEEARRRIPLHPAGELQYHHPRRRSVREGVDLAGDPVVRRAPHRPCDAAHRGPHDLRG
jgi:adenosine deaminase